MQFDFNDFNGIIPLLYWMKMHWSNPSIDELNQSIQIHYVYVKVPIARMSDHIEINAVAPCLYLKLTYPNTDDVFQHKIHFSNQIYTEIMPNLSRKYLLYSGKKQRKSKVMR